MEEVFNKIDYLNYEFMNKNYWWSYKTDEEYEKTGEEEFIPEKSKEFKTRLGLFIIWLILREEKNICMISHSKVYKTLAYSNVSKDNKSYKKQKIKHGGYFVLNNGSLLRFINNYINPDSNNIW